MKKLFVLFGVSFGVVSLLGFSSALEASTADFIVRDGGTIIFSGSVPLPEEGMVDLSDNAGTPHSINSRSVLSVLSNADLSSSDFSISNLEYYSSFNSLYLKCITGTATGEKCDNWQYTVNNSYPGIGMDQKILSGDESVYLYFGSQYRVILSSGEITTADVLTVTSEEYNYQDNTWGRRSGVTVGLTQPDPDNPWSPIEIQTSVVDGGGEAVFSSIPEGSYNVGVKEDFYFPVKSLNVAALSFSGGGAVAGSGEIYVPTPVEKTKFDINKAFEFIISQQKEDGSFGEDLYTDWIALALASGNYQGGVIKLIKYFGESQIDSVLLTDYERRAMALLSLGLNPHNTNGINYIEKITSGFDGTQFGDASLVNDDIFALIVLQKVGYAEDESIVSSTINHVLSKQRENGSWEDSVDMTAAGIQALGFLESEQVRDALVKAKDFLKHSQKDTGGWGNVSSTAWVMGAIIALKEKPEDWNKNDNTPIDYMAASQDVDGGIKNEYMQNRIWETAYATTAASGKDWNQIMQKFDKKSEETKKEKENETEKAVSAKSPTKKSIKNTGVVQTAAALSASDDVKMEAKEEGNKNWLWSFFEKIFGLIIH